MYSFSLVIWEILNRTRLVLTLDPDINEADQSDMWNVDYALPYHDNVGQDPQVDEMKRVVCEMKDRPKIHPEWQRNKVSLLVEKSRFF